MSTGAFRSHPYLEIKFILFSMFLILYNLQYLSTSTSSSSRSSILHEHNDLTPNIRKVERNRNHNNNITTTYESVHVCIAGQYRKNDWNSIKTNIVDVNPSVTVTIVTWADTPASLTAIEHQAKSVFGTNLFKIIAESYETFLAKKIEVCYGNVAKYTYLRSLCGEDGAYPLGSGVHIILRPDLRIHDPIRINFFKKNTTIELDASANGKKPLTLWQAHWLHKRNLKKRKFVVSNVVLLHNNTIAVGVLYSSPRVSANDHIAIGSRGAMVGYYKYFHYLNSLNRTGLDKDSHPFCDPLHTERYYLKYMTEALKFDVRYVDMQYDIVDRCLQRSEYAEDSRHFTGTIWCAVVQNIWLYKRFSARRPNSQLIQFVKDGKAPGLGMPYKDTQCVREIDAIGAAFYGEDCIGNSNICVFPENVVKWQTCVDPTRHPKKQQQPWSRSR